MTDLAARLQKVIEERLAVAVAAREGSEGRWHQIEPEHEHGRIHDDRGEVVTYDEGSPTAWQAEHIALNDPADAILECEFALALLDEMAHWRHVLTDDYLHTCSVATEERGGKCDCGVDARRTRLLALLAKRYGLEVDGG